jgi:hypothetical protein
VSIFLNRKSGAPGGRRHGRGRPQGTGAGKMKNRASRSGLNGKATCERSWKSALPPLIFNRFVNHEQHKEGKPAADNPQNGFVFTHFPALPS